MAGTRDGWGSRTRASKARTSPLVGISFVVAAALLAALCAGASWGATAGKPRQSAETSVVVRAVPGSESAAAAAVRRLGGSVGTRLSIIHGFAAKLPGSAVARLRHSRYVVSVTADAVARAEGSSYSPVSDTGSMLNTSLMTGAQAYWQAGFTGKGVDVALIDSGVAPVDGLTGTGKIVNGADLSFESQAPNLRYLDTYGHGTHMAGIIAGRAGAAVSGAYVGDQTNFLGMAPDARIVSVKVADAHGATDVSQVIAAIDWVVQHRYDSGLNIRVLNLSYGTDSSQDPSVDPLAYAAEQAWKAGIVVVTAAGNAGFVQHTGSMTDPATDPYVIAVGAADTQGTNTLADDTVASFSASGNQARMPDLIAPGVHVVSLRDPGSTIDQTCGGSGYVTDGLFRGSGTSQAAAVVSGAVALLLQQRPSLAPDDVKALLMQTTYLPFQSESKFLRGRGELNLTATLLAPTPLKTAQKDSKASGKGALELSRGSTHLAMNGVTLSGEVDIFGKAFDSSAMAKLEDAASSWSGGTWNGSTWSGSTWSASSWSGSSWSTAVWNASSWSGSSWSSVIWSASSWSGSSWSASSWSANSWLGSSWSGDTWASDAWAASSWS